MEKLNTVTADVRRLEGAHEAPRPASSAQGAGDFASVLDRVQDPVGENPARSQPDAGTGGRTAPATAASATPLKPGDPAGQYTVRSGDSLSAIAQNLARQRGLGINASESYRLALDLAARNQIRNPDRILPGQNLQLDGLHSALDQAGQGRALAMTSTPTVPGTAPPHASARVQSTQNWLAQRVGPAPNTPLESPPAVTAAATEAQAGSGDHPVLRQTLERAVAKGFIPPQEKQAVQGKILQLAQKYQFAPDDFARMTLMESDGMNPRASNQRCHGIIQFCDGPNRGAASVGYGQQPRAILGLSVYQQLHLVDNYFQDNGLGKQGPAKLDDLYLTVLQPAARQEKQAHVPLNIPGPQARDLHVGANPLQAITRQSIVQGLIKNTQDKLSQVLGQALSPKPERVQIAQNNLGRANIVR